MLTASNAFVMFHLINIRNLSISSILAYCSIYAILSPVVYSEDIGNPIQHLLSNFPPMDFSISLIFLTFVGLYLHTLNNKSISLELLFFSLTVVFCQLVCRSFYFYDSFYYVLGGQFQFINFILNLIGFTPLFYIGLITVIKYLKKLLDQGTMPTQKLKYRWHIVLILLLWIPIIVTYLPGSAAWDTYAMLIAWSGDSLWYAHHPVLPTILWGLLMDFGNNIYNANLGALLILLLNFSVIFLSVLLTIEYCYKLWPNKALSYAIAIYYAIIPIFPMYIQTLYKDSINFALITLLTILVSRILTEETWLLKKKRAFYFFLILVLVTLFRHTGIYLVFFLCLLLTGYMILKKNKQKSVFLGVVVLTFLTIFTINKIVIPLSGIAPGKTVEMLAIPYQQTARYMKYYPNDLTQEEFTAINNVLEANKIGNVYLPYLFDPVKNTSKSEDPILLKEYFHAWFSMFKKHPEVYFSATIANVYSYFSFETNNNFFGNELYSYIMWPTPNLNNGRYPVNYFFNSELRNNVTFLLNDVVKKIPIVGLIYYPGIYTWILLFLLLVLLRKHYYKETIVFVPSIMTLMFCLASPVNGSVRYMLPIIATLPILFIWVLYCLKYCSIKS